MPLLSELYPIGSINYTNVSADSLNIFETKYSITDLEFIMKHFNISLTCILTTQKLTVPFCKEYILREDELYCQTEGDEYLTVDDIVEFQPHIKRDAFDEWEDD